MKVIPILNNNETNEKECFPPINGGLSEFIVYSICLPNNEVWYKLIRQKNDQTDAEVIADYCQRQEPSSWTPPSPEMKKLKHLYRCSYQFLKINRRIKKDF